VYERGQLECARHVSRSPLPHLRARASSVVAMDGFKARYKKNDGVVPELCQKFDADC
jgi:hypothetical protein